jgi:hypothetical protein
MAQLPRLFPPGGTDSSRASRRDLPILQRSRLLGRGYIIRSLAAASFAADSSFPLTTSVRDFSTSLHGLGHIRRIVKRIPYTVKGFHERPLLDIKPSERVFAIMQLVKLKARFPTSAMLIVTLGSQGGGGKPQSRRARYCDSLGKSRADGDHRSKFDIIEKLAVRAHSAP